MRTLFEIIESAKDGNMPSHEECYWAMLALDALGMFDRSALRSLVAKPDPFCNSPKYQYEESFNRTKLALAKDPKTWVGPNHDPANPEYQARRALHKKIADRVLANAEPPESSKS